MLGTKATVVFGALAAWALLVAPVARATSLDFIPVGDPLEDELRVLDVSGAPLRLPRMDMRPIQVVDLPALNESLSGPAEISRQRLLRSLARDRGLPGVPGTTPRLLEIREPDDQILEFSAGL